MTDTFLDHADIARMKLPPVPALRGRLDHACQSYHLCAGTVLSGRCERSRLLLVKRGYVWITQEGRSEDFWLHAGDGIIVSAHRLLVIEAEHDSELSWSDDAAGPSASWLGALGARLVNLLRRAGRRNHVQKRAY